MKNVTYIALIAAFVFGVQPQEAFCAENNAIEMEKGGKGDAQIAFDQESQLLKVNLRTGRGEERVQINVFYEGAVVAREFVVGNHRGLTVELSLEGLPSGTYTVKVESESIDMTQRFKKK